MNKEEHMNQSKMNDQNGKHIRHQSIRGGSSMIRFSSGEGVIKNSGIHIENPNYTSVPEVCVGVFAQELFEFVEKNFKLTYIGYISSANGRKKVYAVDYKGKEITFFMAAVGGPAIAGDMEELIASGAKKFVIFGNCGVLDKTIEDCGIIIPTKAFRDEGTSQHYVPDSETIDLNTNVAFKTEFEKILQMKDYEWVEGYTWTTDAFYLETKEKRDYYRSQGCITVEMEGSVIAAVSTRRNVEYFTFYYAGDNLDAVEWERRSISGEDSLHLKTPAISLAFELAIKI